MFDNLGDVISNLVSFFVCMLVGYSLRKKNQISKEFNEGITSLIMKVTLPCVIIYSMQKEYSKDALLNIVVVVVASILVHGFSLLIGVFICKILKTSIKDKSIVLFVMTFTNLSFLGFPVIKAMYGADILFYASIALMVFNLLIFTLGAKLITVGYDTQTKFSISKIFTNIPIVTTFVGLALFVFRITLPQIVIIPVKLLGDTTTSLSMILVGSILASVEIKNIFVGKTIYIVSFVRLVIVPIIVYFILKPFIGNFESGLILKMLAVFAGMPAAALTAIMAEDYKSNSKLGASYVFVTTLFSLFTLPLLFMFFSYI